MFVLGSCSAESRAQVLETARQMVEAFGDRLPFIFRAGIWKPRTSPHSFQGAGEEALKWLKEVQSTYHLPVATEVANSEHVRAAIQAGIDYLWIGARTSANPIAVQEIADTISQISNPKHQISNIKCQISNPKSLLIKNPVNADSDLWLGNIERLERTGIPVIAVHRGCNHQPCWNMAHKVRLARPDIPMLLDPSHMSGEAARVPALMNKVAELGLDGAMIEIHHAPEEALSDAKQQITPLEAATLLTQTAQAITQSAKNIDDLELNWLRAEIDELDERLWDTIAARMEVSQRIGTWKKEHGIAPLQPERYEKIVEKLKAKAAKTGLSEPFMLHIWDSIHEESLKQQK